MPDFELPSIPPPKPWHIPLPTIRLPIHIPQVGCPGADATSLVGEQFGSLPDLYDALHVKHLRKVINDQIYALLKGQLPTALRKVLYLQKAIELINYITSIIAVLNQVIGQAIAEYNAVIGFINQKKAELNAAIAAIHGIPAAAQTATHKLALQRYQEYLGELDKQIARLNTSISCIAE
ncbi:MAG: hypothetical protein WBV94_33585 [Blastocatellia bacterium]